MPADPELTAICRIQNGETGLFDTLVRQYRQPLYAFLRSIVRNDEDAEDLCQETFVRAFRSIGSYKSKCRFSTWLFTIGHNTAKTFLSRYSVIMREDIEDRPDSHNFHDDVETKEIFTFIDEAIRSLPGDKRQVMHLFYRENMSYAEIVGITGISMNTVKSHLFRGKEIVREYLIGHGVTLSEEE
jgi:RNA polymerase sigma-70 factor (ECF subfamily)